MHSFGFRANALLTFSVTILALICAMASLSDNLNSPSPSAHVQVSNINRFQKSKGNDEVSMTLNVSANLQSLFTWNTKQVFVFLAAEYESPKNSLNQVSLWDAIIPSKDQAQFFIQTKNKYRFTDQVIGEQWCKRRRRHESPKIAARASGGEHGAATYGEDARTGHGVDLFLHKNSTGDTISMNVILLSDDDKNEGTLSLIGSRTP